MIAFLVRIMGAGHRRHIAVLLTAAAACMLIGATLFAATQQIPFSKGLYWAITTATTVGYGDVTPHNGAGEVIAAATMLTTIPLLASVFAVVTGAAAAAGIRRILSMRHPFPDGGYRIVLGMVPVMPAILDELVRAKDQVVLVADVDPATMRGEVHVVRGDPTQLAVLEKARPQGASQALITGQTDGDVLVSAVLLRKLAPQLPIVALVGSASVREALRDLGVQQAISAAEMIAHTLAKSLEAPHAADMFAELVESRRHNLREIDAEPAVIGRPLSAIREERAGLVLGLVQAGKFTLGIGDDPVIQAGDQLLLAEPLT